MKPGSPPEAWQRVQIYYKCELMCVDKSVEWGFFENISTVLGGSCSSALRAP